MTLKEYYPQWCACKRIDVKPSTFVRYNQAWQLHIHPSTIADLDIAGIKMSHMQSYTSELFGSGLTRTSVKDILVVVKMLINNYREDNDLPRVQYRVRFPRDKYERKDITTYNERELAVLTDYCIKRTGKRSHLGLLVTMYTGMRIGEVCGIKWEDIDFGRGLIHVRRTVERYTEDGVSSLHVQAPKTSSSCRDIPMADGLRQILMEHRKDGSLYVLSGRVTPSEPYSMRRSFQTICAHAGITEYKFHTLRHTFATRLIHSNIDIPTISALLGHSNPSVTMSFYAHTDMTKQTMAVNINTGAMLQRC